VKGFNVDGGKVIGMATSEEGNYILTVTENGYGKKSLLDDYRMTSRGAKGVKTVNVSEKTGNLVCMRAVNGDEDCMIMTDSGIIIRISLKQVSIYNRAARGVHLINVKDEAKVSTVEILDAEPEDEAEPEAAETEQAEQTAEE
jgi:DNA gyrase subunit A